ncbi:MBL fold metallo-hydrolase [Bacillus sp. FJAT-27445]|uniref:MBL fold metallo-hydrolase n=1 Tax=Bacillus sp. FJAT-27445 TaxID=1679166 RepID=UPI0007443938|nr:MBL fold metallo-hydrolase [Bacillus sp. FJAT-27445]
MRKIPILLSLILLLGIFLPNLNATATEGSICDQYKGVTKIWWDGIELKSGQIGRLTILKDTPLFKLDGDKKIFSRTLKKGEFYRIYAFKPGMLSVGGGYFVDRDSRVSYQTPSKTKLQAVQCINGGIPAPSVKAHFINVGQGDSILITLTNGKNILVDGGKREYGDELVSYLNKVGVKTVDLLVATHPDADHIGGLISVLKSFPVKQVLDSGKEHTTQTYLEYLSLIDSRNIPFSVAKVGQVLNLDSNVKITVLNSGEGLGDNNEASVALKTTYGNMDILLTGDAEANQEKVMMEKFNVEAEIFKAAHHGSNTGNSLEFIKKVNPKATVLSYGKDNSYGHPHKEVVDRLTQLGSKLYSTADSGTIVFTLTKTAYSVSANPWLNTPAPAPKTSEINILSVDKAAEVVKIKNSGTTDANLTGWKLVSVEGNQTFTFPSGYMLKAGSTVSVTSGPNAVSNPPTQLKWTTGNMWNNTSSDPAQLYNVEGVIISEVK